MRRVLQKCYTVQALDKVSTVMHRAVVLCSFLLQSYFELEHWLFNVFRIATLVQWLKRFAVGRPGSIPLSNHTEDFKSSIRSFLA